MRVDRRGAVLLIVLVLVLALGAVSTSALVLARSELVADRGGQAYLRRHTEGEAVLRDDGGTPVSEGWTRIEVELGSGYRLVEARPDEGLSMFAVTWVLDPEGVVATFPGALWTWSDDVPDGVRWLEGCPSPATRPLVMGHVAQASGAEPAPSWPAIGPLGIEQLLALPGRDLADSGLMPEAQGADVLRADADTRIWGGEAEGLLVANGDLTLEGSARFRGLLVVRGQLGLGSSAVVEGVALVGGVTTISEGAQLLGCPDLVLGPLGLPPLAGEHRLPAGSFLGRY